MNLALSFISESIWAITDESLKTLISVSLRENEIGALEKSLGFKVHNTKTASIRGGIGILPINGPTFKRANLFTEISGATSYEILLRDLSALVENPSVKAILLNIDSPGGEANGAAELAEHIYQAKFQKPIFAFVGGMGASAAYWLASSSKKIFAAETSLIGSIGVQSVVKPRDQSKELSFVSSVSPNKNRDPGTELGAAEVQRTVDAMGQIFVSKVARNRGISEDAVIERYGQGSIFVGEKAFQLGMIDQITTFEGALLAIEEELVDIPKEQVSGDSLGANEMVAKSEERIFGILKFAKGRVSDEYAMTLVQEKISLDDAKLRILLKAEEDRGSKIVDLKKADEFLSGLSSKPLPNENDSFESDLSFAQCIGLVTLS